jgi:hypothetical protein
MGCQWLLVNCDLLFKNLRIHCFQMTNNNSPIANDKCTSEINIRRVTVCFLCVSVTSVALSFTPRHSDDLHFESHPFHTHGLI